GPRSARIAALHPLRGLPGGLPGVPARRRTRLWMGLPGPHRGGAHPSAPRSGARAGFAVRLVAMRRLPGRLPGADRHSAYAVAPPRPRGGADPCPGLVRPGLGRSSGGLGDGVAGTLRLRGTARLFGPADPGGRPRPVAAAPAWPDGSVGP